MNVRRVASVVVALAAFLPAKTAHSAEIRVLSGNALKPVLETVGPQFEKANNHRLVITVYNAATLKQLLDQSETFDLVIVSQQAADELSKQKKIVVDTRIELARSGIGVIIRTGAPKPDIGTTDTFKRMLLNAHSIAFIERAPTGIYLKGLFQSLGITEQLNSKIKPVATAVAKAIADGEAEIGMTQMSEILGAAGVELAGPLPPEIQQYLVLSAAVGAESRNPEAALQLIRFLASQAAGDVIKAKGLETLQ